MKKLFTLITVLTAFMAVQAQNLTDNISDSYSGYVKIVITTDDGTAVSDPIDAKVEIVKKDNNLIDFHLNDFILSNGGDIMPVGNIALSDILLTATEYAGEVVFQTSQEIFITEGDAEILQATGFPMWMGPMLSPIPVDLQGTASSSFADIDIDINLVDMGQVVHVDFIAGERDTAINDITANNSKAPAYNILGQRANHGLIIQNGRKYIRK